MSSRCDTPATRWRRTVVDAMTLTRPLTQTTAAPPTFADAAERHLDDVFGYLLYLTRDRPLADDLAGRHVREGAPPVVAVRPTPRQRPHLAARDRPHDRARLVPGRVPAPPARGGRSRARGAGGRVRRRALARAPAGARNPQRRRARGARAPHRDRARRRADRAACSASARRPCRPGSAGRSRNSKRR